MSEVTHSTTKHVWPASWYADPWRPDWQPTQERWYDGNEWTDQVRTTVVPSQVNVSQVVTVPADRKRTSHLLHFILTLLTAGLWLPVWIIVAMARS